MLREALRYPLVGDRGDVAETLAVGGGLHLLAVYVPVLPLVFVVGYLVRVLGTDGAGEPPRFRDPRRLARDGVLGSVVIVVYLAPPVVALAVTAGGLFRLGAGEPSPATYGITLVGGTATLLFAAAFAYLLPAALALLARDGLRAAFAPGALRSFVSGGRYFYGWCVGAVALGVAAALAPALNLIALGFFVMFYAEVSAAAAWARGVRAPDRRAAATEPAIARD